MQPSRRAFIATAASIPAVAVASSIPAAAELPTIRPEHPWNWYVSLDGGEMYNEECNSLEEAIRVAKEYGGGLVAECQRQDYYLEMDGGAVLETLYGQNEEAIGEGEFIECTDEEERDLGKMVSRAIEDWATKHKINIAAWTFGGVRNKTIVEPIPGTTDQFTIAEKQACALP